MTDTRATFAHTAADLGLAVYRSDTAATIRARIDSHLAAQATAAAENAARWALFDCYTARRRFPVRRRHPQQAFRLGAPHHLETVGGVAL